MMSRMKSRPASRVVSMTAMTGLGHSDEVSADSIRNTPAPAGSRGLVVPMADSSSLTTTYGTWGHLANSCQCPLPKFVNHCGTPLTRTSEAKGTGKFMILVPLFDLKFLDGPAAGAVGTSNRRHQTALLPRPIQFSDMTVPIVARFA